MSALAPAFAAAARLSAVSFPDSVYPGRTFIRLFILTSVLMAGGIWWGIWIQNEPGRVFREGKLMTWASFVLLCGVGRISHHIWSVRCPGGKCSARDARVLWRLLSIGFVFLAFDDLCRIHEAVDRYSHKIAGMNPHGLTGHADDLLIILYGIVGAVCLLKFWRETLLFLKRPVYFIGAAALSIAQSSLDVLSGGKNWLSQTNYFDSPQQLLQFVEWAAVAEEIAKIYAEVFFVAAFLSVYVVARGQVPAVQHAGSTG